jgi:hypothetical protein
MKDRNLDSAEIPKIVFSPKMDAFGTVDLAVGPAMCSFVPESELLGEEYGSYRRDMAHSSVLNSPIFAKSRPGLRQSTTRTPEKVVTVRRFAIRFQ